MLVRRTFVGINASDINYTSGRYHSSRKEAEQQLPFDAGFETVGVVAAVGDGVAGGGPTAAEGVGGAGPTWMAGLHNSLHSMVL